MIGNRNVILSFVILCHEGRVLFGQLLTGGALENAASSETSDTCSDKVTDACSACLTLPHPKCPWWPSLTQPHMTNMANPVDQYYPFQGF